MMMPARTGRRVIAAAATAAAAGCRPRPAAELKIYPPDQYGSTHALWDLGSCTIRGRIYLTVQPIQPGTGVHR